MDAPLITLDDAANTTDVYAFVSQLGGKMLVAALGVYPFEEPGIGPNKYNFDDNVLYEIHVAAGNDDVQAGRATYQLPVPVLHQLQEQEDHPPVVPRRHSERRRCGAEPDAALQGHEGRSPQRRATQSSARGVVPPNNQGNATPLLQPGQQRRESCEGRRRQPVRSSIATRGSRSHRSDRGYLAFAGQRDDGFYADIQAVFDLLKLRSPGKDSQGGFNVHTMVLAIPLSDIGGDQQVAGVYATTQPAAGHDSASTGRQPPTKFGRFVQVARQGNPLFNEGLVAIEDKDLYSRTSPGSDSALFRKYAENPELAKLLNALVLDPDIPGIETDRTDISSIFIPDLIKVDLSTDPARLAGGGPMHPTNPDDPGFSRLSIFGNDVLFSPLKGGIHARRLAERQAVRRRRAGYRGERAHQRSASQPAGHPDRWRQRRSERHRIQQGVPLRRHPAERTDPRSSVGCEKICQLPIPNGCRVSNSQFFGSWELAHP